MLKSDIWVLIKLAGNIILRSAYWSEVTGFPRQSFHKPKGKIKELDRILFHAKVIIVTNKKNSSEIDDETTLYFGSHNLSPGACGNIEKEDT
jgi:phosphatidylserine/phosphatidylglycerophosphate/cardiolipin synthase-like enzyme